MDVPTYSLMVPRVTFRVVGQPVAKERPRLGRYGNVYTPTRTVDYEEEVGRSFVAASPFPLDQTSRHTGPVALRVMEYRRIPNSWPQWKRMEAQQGRIMPTTRPDLDNVLKSLKDGLTANAKTGKVGAYKDDSQVVDVVFIRRYCDGFEPQPNEPSCEVTIYYLTGLDPIEGGAQ
jgi:Holliday junction resolvase RusA-like endonuclease